MALDAVIPEVWAGRLLANLNDSHVYAGLGNRDYEGDIKEYGDVVRINSIGRVTVSSYTKNTTIGAPETLNAEGQTLTVDQASYINFQIDDVDKRQQRPKLMDDAMAEAAWRLSDTMDENIATHIAATGSGFDSASTGNRLADTTVVSSDENAYGLLVDLKVKLDEDNTPSSNRWVVVPPFFHGALLQDQRFVSFGTGENRSVLTNGAIGRAAGFTIHLSNNVPTTGTGYKVLAGYPGALSLAEQIPMDSFEFYRPQNRFGDAVKGLHLWGRRLVRPDNVAMVVAVDGG